VPSVRGPRRVAASRHAQNEAPTGLPTMTSHAVVRGEPTPVRRAAAERSETGGKWAYQAIIRLLPP